MKENIQKLADLNKEAVELLKEEKMDKAIEKLAQVQEITSEMDKANEKIVKSEDEKTNIAKQFEEIQKGWAELRVSAESVKALMEDLGEVKEMIAKNSETTSEIISKLKERLETVENAKAISKQTKEDVKKSEGGLWDNVF